MVTGIDEQTKIYARLLTAAREGRPVTYTEAAQAAGFAITNEEDSRRIGALVGAISFVEHNESRPMLSSIVVRSSGGIGGGFFTLAIELGKLPAGADDGTKARFVAAEQAATFAAWGLQVTPE
jgi:hypothetical protein